MQILKPSRFAVFSRQWRALLLLTLLGLGAAQPSFAAMSSGCTAINSHWGSGITLSGGNDDWREGNAVTTGEKITYQVTSFGSTIDPAPMNLHQAA